MMLEPLDNHKHRNLKVMTYPSAEFGDRVGMIGVVPREFTRLIAHFPLLFRKDAETGQFEAGALMGLANEENLFLKGRAWDATHLPLHVLRQPFQLQLVGVEDGKNQLIITLDPDHPRFGAVEGERLFDDDGNPTSYLLRVQWALGQLADGLTESAAFFAKLTELDLIEPLRLDVTLASGEDIKLQGLYAVHDQRLKDLNGAALIELRDRGYLEWIYAHLASLSQLQPLAERKNRASITP
jgi:hypothetical protein